MGYHNRQRKILMNEGETQVPKRWRPMHSCRNLTLKPPAAPPVLSIRCTADVASSVPPEFRMASAPACGLEFGEKIRRVALAVENFSGRRRSWSGGRR
jgi:hypothetical protein